MNGVGWSGVVCVDFGNCLSDIKINTGCDTSCLDVEQ